MHIPKKLPGRRLLTVILVAFSAIWIALEGDPVRVTLLAALLMIWLLSGLVSRVLGGRNVSLARWLALWAGLGLFFGLGSSLLTLFLMAIKTGLHAHGAEFTAAQIAQVIARTPVWVIGGLLLGLALGLLSAGLGWSRQPAQN